VPLLNGADSLYIGGQAADRAYLGSTLVWERIRLVEKTWSGYGAWTGTYGSDGERRNDSYAYYGYYSSTWGNQRSLVGFDVPNEVKNADSITSIRFKIYNRHHYLNSGGRIYLGTHDYSSRPGTWDGSRVDEQINDYAAPKPGWVDETLGSNFRDAFKAGAKGIALGPGPSNSQSYYGYADDHTQANKPWLKIVYKVWE